MNNKNSLKYVLKIDNKDVIESLFEASLQNCVTRLARWIPRPSKGYLEEVLTTNTNRIISLDKGANKTDVLEIIFDLCNEILSSDNNHKALDMHMDKCIEHVISIFNATGDISSAFNMVKDNLILKEHGMEQLVAARATQAIGEAFKQVDKVLGRFSNAVHEVYSKRKSGKK